jgi:prevent-host-death family protein
MDDHTAWAETASVRDARAHLSEIVNRAAEGTPTVLTRHGRQVAAVVSVGELQLIEDAIDGRFADEAREALAEMESGRGTAVTTIQVLAELFDEKLPPSVGSV